MGAVGDLFQNVTAADKINLSSFAGLRFADLTINTLGVNVFGIALPGGQNLTVYAEGPLDGDDFIFPTPTNDGIVTVDDIVDAIMLAATQRLLRGRLRRLSGFNAAF